MKVLLISKYHYLRGGAEKAMLQEAELLQEHGHNVVFFGMHHPKNRTTPFSKYFISYVNPHSISGAVKEFFRGIYSPEAAQKIKKLIKDEKPDVAHLHFFDLAAPTILPILKKRGVPVVMTAHDYKLICPHYQLNFGGILCSKNVLRHILQTIWHKRFNDSFLASVAVSITWLAAKLRRTYEKNIDLVIVPAKFMAEQLKSWGWNFAPLEVLPNFVEIPEVESHGGEFVFFAGRLSAEKGTKVLAEVAEILPNIPFCAAGEGHKLPAVSNLIAVGYQKPDELKEYYRRARIFFFPSIWEEVCPMVLLEAASFALPIVASNVGGVPEIVEDGRSGYLYSPAAKPIEIAELIRRLWHEPDLRLALGLRGREIIQDKFSPDRHYQKLVKILEGLTKES